MLKQETMKIMSLSNDGSIHSNFPVYTMTCGRLFRTINHSLGWSERPDYVLATDGKLYRTEYHAHGNGDLPDYEFRGDGKLYRTENHPDGLQVEPEFAICD